MVASPPVQEQQTESIVQEASEIVNQLSGYGSLIYSSLFLIIIGMVVVFIIHKLTSRFLYPYLKNTRLVKVVLGTMYVMILVIAVLMALQKIGIDTSAISKVAVLCVLSGAVVIFFLVPFLPRLPFKIGQMIEVGGVTGIVANISTAHTTLRTFDGSMVFIPNPVILASRITNFHEISERRIAMNLDIKACSDIQEALSLLLEIMGMDARILAEPAPPVVRATGGDAAGVKLTAFCWVKNAEFLDVQSDLWLKVSDAFNENDRIVLARSQEEIFVMNEDNALVPE